MREIITHYIVFTLTKKYHAVQIKHGNSIEFVIGSVIPDRKSNRSAALQACIDAGQAGWTCWRTGRSTVSVAIGMARLPHERSSQILAPYMSLIKTLGNKVIAISLIALAIVVTLSINSIRDQLELKHETDLLLRDSGQAALSADFDVALVRAAGEVASFAVTRSKQYLAEAKEAVARAYASLDGLRKTLGEHPPTEGLESKHLGFVNRQREILAMIESSIDLAQKLGDNADQLAVSSVLDKVYAYEPFAEDLRKGVSLHRQEEYRANERDIRHAADVAINTIIANLAVLLLLIAIAYFFTRRFVVRPINQVSAAASAVAKGNLNQTVALAGKDEIGHLQMSFNQMVSDLHDQNRTVTERTRQLAETVDKVQQAEARLRHFAAAMNTGIESERSRIAHALHDELGQHLTALGMYLGRLQKQHLNNDAAQETIGRSQAIVTDAGSAMRRIVRDLRPLALDNFGLVAAAESLLKDFSSSTGIPAEINAQSELDDLADTHKTALYRVLQESLNNVAKHAQATFVEVRVEENNGGVALTVRDNGRGFSRDVQAKPNSYGLFGMAERAAQYGGSVDIDTAPDAGTKIAFWLPLAVRAGPNSSANVH